MQWDFVDLGPHGRALRKVVLPGACEMLAFSVTGTGRQAKLHPDEAEYLRRCRFREAAPGLFVRAGSVVAEAGFLQVYRRSRTVPFDPATHVADVLPGEGPGMRALTLAVAAGIVLEEFQDALAELRSKDGTPPGKELAMRLGEQAAAFSTRTQALARYESGAVPESEDEIEAHPGP